MTTLRRLCYSSSFIIFIIILDHLSFVLSLLSFKPFTYTLILLYYKHRTVLWRTVIWRNHNTSNKPLKTFPMTRTHCACAARGASRLASSLSTSEPQPITGGHSVFGNNTQILHGLWGARNFLNQEPLPFIVSCKDRAFIIDRIVECFVVRLVISFCSVG